MATANSSNILSSTFYLTGIPGYEEFHHWISIPFCLLYLVGIMGNCTILHIVQIDPRLHEPMYYFWPCFPHWHGHVLAHNDTTQGAVVHIQGDPVQHLCSPNVFHSHFLLHWVICALGHGPWLICGHLPPPKIRYHSHSNLITKIGIAALLRSAFAMIPLLAQLAFFPFCHSHILSHSYCLHQDVIRLACADTKFNVIYGMVMITLLWGMDLWVFLCLMFSSFTRY